MEKDAKASFVGKMRAYKNEDNFKAALDAMPFVTAVYLPQVGKFQFFNEHFKQLI